MVSAADKFILDLPLKQMDATVLSRAITIGAQEHGMDVDLFDKAVTYAAYLHRNQTRKARAHLPLAPYAEHPFRNTVRLQRFDVTDQDTLLASVLHDTVEDCLVELCELAGADTPSEEAAFAFYATEFSQTVSDTVRGVTNPEMPAGATKAEKHVIYRAHVIEAIQDPRVALVKFADFVDNAFSLHHHAGEHPGMVENLAKKYGPLVGVFEERLDRPDIAALVSEDGREAIDAAFLKGWASIMNITFK